MSCQNREFARQATKLHVSGQRMHAFRKGHHSQKRVRLIEILKLCQYLRVAGITGVEGDAARDHLCGELGQLPTKAVVNRLQNSGVKVLPRLAGEQRRNIVGIQLRLALGLERPPHLGNGQDAIAGLILRG